MYWIRNCQNHFSLFDGKAGGCYQCTPGYVVSKDRRGCIDLKQYLDRNDTLRSRDVISCRIFKNERPGDCQPNETDGWTGIDPDFGEFQPSDNSYSSAWDAINGIRTDLDCQAPPLQQAPPGGNNTGRRLGDADDDDENLKARTLATDTFEPGHWECGECLQDAVASPDNMKCRSKTKTLKFNFKPAIDYDNIDQSFIQVIHYDDSFVCQTKEFKSPSSYDTPVANQYIQNAEYVGVGKKIGVCTCQDLSEYLVGVYMTNNTLACHNHKTMGVPFDGIGHYNQNKVWCSHKSSTECTIEISPFMNYQQTVNYTATHFELYNYDTQNHKRDINTLITELTSPYNIQNQVVLDEPAKVVRLEVSVGYYAEMVSPTGVYNSTFIEQFTESSPIQEVYATSEIHCPHCNSEYARLIKPIYAVGWPTLSRNAFAFKLWHKSVVWGCGDSCMRCNKSFYDLSSDRLSPKCQTCQPGFSIDHKGSCVCLSYGAVNNYLASGQHRIKVESKTIASDSVIRKTIETKELCAQAVFLRLNNCSSCFGFWKELLSPPQVRIETLDIDTVELQEPRRAVPEILLTVKGLLVGDESNMPPVPQGCESALSVTVKQTWAEKGSLVSAAGISQGSSELTDLKGNFRYDNASSHAFISIYPPLKYCVVMLEVALTNKIWQNNMESCGASEVNQEPFMVKELFKYSSCYMFLNGICQCWPSFITPTYKFEECVQRHVVDDPLRYCMKTEKANPAKCELCIIGSKLYKGETGQESQSKGKCVYQDAPGKYLPTSICSQVDDTGKFVQDESCHACHCTGDCDSECNPMTGTCIDFVIFVMASKRN